MSAAAAFFRGKDYPVCTEAVRAAAVVVGRDKAAMPADAAIGRRYCGAHIVRVEGVVQEGDSWPGFLRRLNLLAPPHP